MAGVWETEDEASVNDAVPGSLPTPPKRRYRTPSRDASRGSRRSRRSDTATAPSSSPPPRPSDRTGRSSKRSSAEVTVDDSISFLDPRRFTPTLHASLVSEILSLRRDQEEKLKIIESLESSLESTREEQESLQTNLANTAKDNRSIRRQLSLIEGGTSSAIGDLVRERDEAVEAITDAKRRLENVQKKARSQEEDSQRVHDLWAKEKDDWDEERRKYERKLHVADTRMKALLEEFSNLQIVQASLQQSTAESEAEDGKEGDAASVRAMSITNSIRYSVIPGKTTCLADELNFNDDDSQTENDGRESVLSNHTLHMRNRSRDSIISRSSPVKVHHRNFSNDSIRRPGSVARGRLYFNQTVLERVEGQIREDDENQPSPKPQYTDTGVQYSPPPSPIMTPTIPVLPDSPKTPTRGENLPEADRESSPQTDAEIEDNQRKVCVPLSNFVSVGTFAEPAEAAPIVKCMVSTSCQTVESPPSPPRTPKSPVLESPPQILDLKPIPEFVSSSTQTDQPPHTPPSSFSLPTLPIPVPSISIVPPTSRPTTPREHRLPQYVKDFGCQVSLSQTVSMTTSSMQTDEIRIDQRLDKLPPHLHPSAISSRPTSPATEKGKQGATGPSGVPPRNPRRLASRRSVASDIPSSPPGSPGTGDDDFPYPYSPSNHDGSTNHKAITRRPRRVSSLFAGFDSDEAEYYGDDMSDSEYRTALSAPKPQSAHGRLTNRRNSNNSSPLDNSIQALRQAKSSAKQLGGPEVYSSFTLSDSRRSLERRSSTQGNRFTDKLSGSSSRTSIIRKSAMIKNGIASHRGRSRSPSIHNSRDPPFPIPARASSRRPLPLSVSAPSDGSRSPPGFDDSWHRRGFRGGSFRSNNVRKVRSATAISRNHRSRRSVSRSSPPMSPGDEMPGTPTLPPLPAAGFTTPRNRELTYGAQRYRSHRSQPSTNTANTAITENTNFESVTNNTPQSSVVDAIAQTMVGEWMFKYVRRRKSFGVADAKAEENSNDRHKRWVWLAPYERSILWSSKQPSSGSALLGKSGRKLAIQSVLDVKDDNPAPKGTGQLFNRSVLILTPERALKFTATTAERHYLWLTALSFLAHSSQSVPDLLTPSAPPPPKFVPNFEAPPPEIKAKKPRVRDSIRLTKGKNPALSRPDGDVAVDAEQLEEALAFKSEAFAPLNFDFDRHQREASREVAEPPFVPRFHDRGPERVPERANQGVLHGRKRSNTGGHVPPPLSFRGFSGPGGTGSSYHTATNSTAGNSVGTAGSSDIYMQGSSGGNTMWDMSMPSSRRASETSSGPPPNNFFEAIGTVRMEAFISPLSFPMADENPYEQDDTRHRAPRRGRDSSWASRGRQRDSYASRTTRGTTEDSFGASKSNADDELFLFRENPFKGF